MAEQTFVVAIPNCTYGIKGELVKLDVPASGLTARQKLMLKPYKEPVAKKLEVATPKADPKSDAKPDQKSGAGSQQKGD